MRARVAAELGADGLQHIGLGRVELHEAGRLSAESCEKGAKYASAERVLGSHMHMTFNRVFGPDPEKERRLLRVLRSASARLAKDYEWKK
ncbi:lantibiotic dehydratase C-terminal domain-containing protein [Actinomyces ruminis]|uniref:lantibiotic dehydratase C-terminal domain-containing protein n=1 Tax=Actinomyces ruminis TaxID=1937003 RepID=UPI003B846440